MKGVKTLYSVIDEAVKLSDINQHLRTFMDNAIGCVILTINHIHALDNGIRDRADDNSVYILDKHHYS